MDTAASTANATGAYQDEGKLARFSLQPLGHTLRKTTTSDRDVRSMDVAIKRLARKLGQQESAEAGAEFDKVASLSGGLLARDEDRA